MAKKTEVKEQATDDCISYPDSNYESNQYENVNNMFDFHVDIQVRSQDLMPTRAHDDDSGFDLRAAEDTTIFAGEICKVPTGVRLKMPRGVRAEVSPRSGLSLKGIRVANAPGIIDTGYRGEVCAILHNTSSHTISFKRLDRIAQIIFMRAYNTHLEVVESIDEDTQRGANGFGSSGTR